MLMLPPVEVMDKELTVPEGWVVAALVSVGGYITARWRPWLAAAPLGILVGLGASVALQLADPYVGPAILKEAGASYPLRVYSALVVAGAATFAGVFHGRSIRSRAA
jgi:hypothetical protein